MRRLLLLLSAALATAAPTADAGFFPAVTPGASFAFPRDHGAHPAFRTEWWYFTGWLQTADGKPLGFQITFFRSRPAGSDDNPSAFAPKQVVFAHAALSDPGTSRLLHDQRIARAGFGIAGAASGDTDVALLGWALRRGKDGRFRAAIDAKDFSLDLTLAPTQPEMRNGDKGYSRKGPRPEQASYYYSLPQLAVAGSIVRNGRREPVTGKAWLDREWSSTLLPPEAVGWDWTGINFDDGSALMAFQVRAADGRRIYAGGTLRRPDGSQIAFGPDDVRFVPLRRWRSTQTEATYPVEAEFRIRLPEGTKRYRLKPMFDAQELAGGGGMPTYWEGAVTTEGGRGYLELTGYADRLSF